jgi:inosose dehydratase
MSAATGFDVRIGINPISWSNDDLPSLGGETPLEVALAEGAAIGYAGFELGNKFPRETAALRAALEPHGLALVSGWYSGRLARRTVDEEPEAARAEVVHAPALDVRVHAARLDLQVG